MSDAEEKPILTLRTCRLYAEDVALFRPAQWLNDACISFFFEALQAAAELYFMARACHENQTIAEGIARWLAEGIEPLSEKNEELLRCKLGLSSPACQPSAGEPASCNVTSRQEEHSEALLSLDLTEQDEAQVCSPILFVDPCVAFWVSMCTDESEVQDTLENLHIPRRSVVVWPITDHQDPSTVGGTHWTLLIQIVCNRAVNRNATAQNDYNAHDPVQLLSGYQYFHFDSIGHNCQQSRGNLAAARRLQALLGRFVKISTSTDSPPAGDHDRSDRTPIPLRCTPPQSNASDCGVHCLLFAERLLQLVVKKDRDFFKGKDNSGDRRSKQTTPSVDVETGPLYPELPFDVSWFSLPDLQRFEPSVLAARRRGAILLVNKLTQRGGGC
ncbi:hypothetical protein NCLIV_037220 [Neospora caninum Liverpool]|uniref:Ubiquitin-like protease family profile domain-containing protein n=1 Tax=Neospora caninum (strain Liverpool) TaxID=572307 RepID=F0VJM9_NEOCL|nr:hypothetical protein NCLIV_037220 [Neospora caninum Liverpool]CBZ53940.1 hypothetical protein NCLIV_037220 [Neospora caninum Liverpool]CEL67938.1 TPA: hypothetical protein BN1204_037220 [Neospora caninum Liverpool]|eukprot:XP_003883972.1 hypothetical protein NCLIV_037220 [Neospora caninum Liverpool]